MPFLCIFPTIFVTQNKKKKECQILAFIPFKNFGLIYSRVGAGAAGAASKFSPGTGAT
jgi:hypothetical protein